MVSGNHSRFVWLWDTGTVSVYDQGQVRHYLAKTYRNGQSRIVRMYHWLCEHSWKNTCHMTPPAGPGLEYADPLNEEPAEFLRWRASHIESN